MLTHDMHVHLFLFYTLIGSFLTPQFAYPDSCIFYFADQVFGENHTHYEDARSSLCQMTQFWYLFMPFILVDSLYGLNFYSILIIHGILYYVQKFICRVDVILSPSQLIDIAYSGYIRLVYVGYFSCEYTSPTLVASPLQRIFRSGA